MEIGEIVRRQRCFFQTGRTKSYAFRKRALERLECVLRKNEGLIQEALKRDLHKSPFESYMTEVGMVYSELSYIKKHLKGWMKEQYVRSPLAQFPSRSFTLAEPYGVVLVMSPWNYPFLLCMSPLIGAIAAGNCCVIKPSAYAASTSKVIHKLMELAFPEKYVAVVEGGREENNLLLEQRFDYIFFTGGMQVGKLAMEKAAAHLTPVTLELGGKSPCIVEESADLNLAAKRIVFGKFLNSGQTCVAPDYLLVQASVQEELLKRIKGWIRNMLGQEPLDNPDYPRMINEKHYERVMGLMQGEDAFYGGYGRREMLQIAPTVLKHITRESAIMQEEIFGPVLPVLTFQTVDEAERLVKQGEKPLACYIFTSSKRVEQRLLRHLSFGGGCVNDTIIHLATSRMGFGGVGMSGMGSYHGKRSFETFSHTKSLVKKYNWLDLPIRYMPYSGWKEKVMRKVLR